MAKAAIEATITEPEEKLPALTDEQRGALVEDDMFFDGPTGLEGVDAKDVSLPRWTILQGLSPQVNSRKDEYVEGAQIGMLFNTATGEIAKEKTFIFAGYQRRYVEWTPRDVKSKCPLNDRPQPVGGGLYRDYGVDDSILDECTRWEENGSLWSPRGNEVLETGTWYTVDPETLATAFIAMARTQFTPSKKLMAGIRDEKQVIGGVLRPALLFYRAWTLGTALKTRAVEGGTNEWFVFNHKPAYKLQEHPNGRAILDIVRGVQAALAKDEVVIDVGIGETEGHSAPRGDDARM